MNQNYVILKQVDQFHENRGTKIVIRTNKFIQITE
jgi:hypothetical protein